MTMPATPATQPCAPSFGRWRDRTTTAGSGRSPGERRGHRAAVGVGRAIARYRNVRNAAMLPSASCHLMRDGAARVSASPHSVLTGAAADRVKSRMILKTVHGTHSAPRANPHLIRGRNSPVSRFPTQPVKSTLANATATALLWRPKTVCSSGFRLPPHRNHSMRMVNVRFFHAERVGFEMVGRGRAAAVFAADPRHHRKFQHRNQHQSAFHNFRRIKLNSNTCRVSTAVSHETEFAEIQPQRFARSSRSVLRFAPKPDSKRERTGSARVFSASLGFLARGLVLVLLPIKITACRSRQASTCASSSNWQGSELLA